MWCYNKRMNTLADVAKASLEQALQINRALDPIIQGLQKTEHPDAQRDAYQLQGMMVKFLVSKDMNILCTGLQGLDNKELRERCFIRVIQNSGILPLVAIAGM